MRDKLETYLDDLPDLDPIVAAEPTSEGWRGLTQEGQVYEVRSSNGHKATMPSEITVAHLGHAIGRRRVTNEWPVNIDDYLVHFNQAVALYKSNNIAEALSEAEATIAAAPTLRAKFNYSMILLAAGRWTEGLAAYWECEQRPPFMRPQVREALDAGLEPWRGEDLRGKKLLVLHAHGFGDSIQCLRFVPQLKATGADVVMVMPPELQRLAAQCGTVVTELQDADYFVPILHLLHLLHVTPDSVSGEPYLKVDPRWIEYWRPRVEPMRRCVGIAWAVGKPSDGDYPREISLRELVTPFFGAALYSVQTQNADAARLLGVESPAFADFADCAAVMMLMDQIISIDTAALHLAGAIGHPNVVGLLSHWASWRWVARWYRGVRLCRQQAPDDWASALAQI